MNTIEHKLFREMLNLSEEALTFAHKSPYKAEYKLIKKQYTSIVKRYQKLIQKKT
jgi:hypothetical protein